MFRRSPERKIFGVGANKTGTSSLAFALKTKGVDVAPQAPAEALIRDWAKRDFQSLVRFCETHQAFQDIPFSFPFTFQAMDQAFPGSKFILTVRDDVEQWYASFLRFHKKRLGVEELTLEAVNQDDYIWKGWSYEVLKLHYGVDDDDLFNPEVHKDRYERHNFQVRDYFRHRPDDLLVLNVSEKDAFERLCSFLELPYHGEPFPWENRSG